MPSALPQDRNRQLSQGATKPLSTALRGIRTNGFKHKKTRSQIENFLRRVNQANVKLKEDWESVTMKDGEGMDEEWVIIK